MNLYFVCSLIIGVISVYLASHKKYEDGVLGKLFLAGLAITSGVIFWQVAFDGVSYEPQPTTEAIFLFISLFFIRHLYRFNKWANGGSFDWRKNEKDTPSNDVVCPLLLGGNKTKSRRKRNPDVLKAGS